jgi:DNA-binding response OmpR family regulator
MARIVICEDDGLLAADLAQTVTDAGHEVTAVYGSAQAALADPAALSADVAIIDLNLADGDSGARVAQALQEAGVRVVILSGNSNATPDLGAIPHTYASKPFSPDLVRALLGAA